MPRGRHRHSPPLHRLLPPSAIAGVSLVCALGPWVFTEPAVLRVSAAVAAATAAVGAAVMRRWDVEAGKRVADLTRARASDEWRHEEQIAELETDLEESRELRQKLEHKLRAKRAELAGLRNEHAALLRRYATAETERASALEGRRLLAIETSSAPSSVPALPAGQAAAAGGSPEAVAEAEAVEVPSQGARPAPVPAAEDEAEAEDEVAAAEDGMRAEAGVEAVAEVSEGAETAEAVEAAPDGENAVEGKPSASGAFSPAGSSLFLRASSALDRIIQSDSENAVDSEKGDPGDDDGPKGESRKEDFPKGESSKAGSSQADSAKGGFAKGDSAKGGFPDGGSAHAASAQTGSAQAGSAQAGSVEAGSEQTGSAEAEAALAADAAEEDDPEGQPEAVDGHERAAAALFAQSAPTASVAPSAHPVPRPALPAVASGHFTVPTAVAVVPGTPQRRPAIEGGFDFFGTQKGASELEAVQNEDLADVVGQEALALHKAESEAQFKPVDEDSRGIGQVIDLTAHDETEQINVQGLRSAVS